MSEFVKIRLIVEPPDGNPVEQLRMSPDELGRRPGRKTTIVTPVGARFFQICEPSLVRAFSYRDVIEAVPLGNDVWRFSRLVAKSPWRQIFLSPELLCSILYLDDRPPYRLIRTVYEMFRRGCPIKQFDDWLILGCPPDLPFDPIDRIGPAARYRPALARQLL